jgi:uncharacterized membrane protein YhaH (DUF805 family)
MAFLRTLFWIAITVIVVVFSVNNWAPVTINLFGDLRADVKLPVLLLIVFLIGFVPPYLWMRVQRWRDKRRNLMTSRANITNILPPAPVAAEPGIGPSQAE